MFCFIFLYNFQGFYSIFMGASPKEALRLILREKRLREKGERENTLYKGYPKSSFEFITKPLGHQTKVKLHGKCGSNSSLGRLQFTYLLDLVIDMFYIIELDEIAC